MKDGKKLLILGAGVCGLYAAYKAAQKGCSVIVLEKRDQVGGLAAGQKVGANFADLGVHMLHAFDQEIFEDIAEVMGDERIEVALDARIQWRGRSLKYPLKSADMLSSMPLRTLSRCVLGLLFAELRRAVRGEQLQGENAEDALITFYGAPLYEYFFEGFTHRYWGMHPRQLSAEFVRRKMPRLTAVDVFRKLLASVGIAKKTDDLVESALEEETLHYSRSGAEAMPRLLRAACERLGVEVHTGVDVEKLTLEGKHVARCAFSSEKGASNVECDSVVSTVPMPDLVQLLGRSVPTPVQQAAEKLRYKPITVFSILVNREKCMDGLYTYYRNRIFHRVGEPKNAGLRVQPETASLLIVEMTCERGDAKWRGEVLEKVFADLEEEGICAREDVIEVSQHHYAHGYPVYALGFENYLAKVNGALSKIENLRSVGRQGAFCYPGMHKAMRMGADAVDDLLGA